MKQIKQKLVILLVIGAWFFCLNAQAALVEDLYSIELAVADQTTTQRLAIFKQAFRNVIVKVSGSPETLKHPGMSRPLKSSARYVRQYRYINRKDESEDNFAESQLFLRVTFNQEAIENLLRSNEIAIWGKERPSTLLLVSYQLNKKTSIIASDTTPEMVDEFELLAQNLGLPVLFPLMDLEDRQLFGVEDILGGNQQNIKLAEARYLPDATLSGQITGLVGKGWQGNWQLSFAEKLHNWTFNAGTREELMSQVVAKLAQTLAQEYALDSTTNLNEQVLFSVDQITRLTDHIKVLSYLKSLDAIETVRPVLVSQDKVTYRMTLRNSTEDLARLISLNYVLEQLDLPQIDTADDKTIMMNYCLVQ